MRVRASLLALLIAAVGCSRAPEPSAARARYDPERARSALIAALDAWKQGKARTLARRKPPIRFDDDDLAAGLRLDDYELEEADAPIALHTDVDVILSLRDPRGQVIRREARYQVAVEPALAVLRSDR